MPKSPLTVYTALSPFYSKRRSSTIDTIMIHCMAGNLSVETCGKLFQRDGRDASSNYGIGSDGRIACYVDEEYRAWTSGGKDKNGNIIRVNGISGADMDHRGITIEVANDGGASTGWHVSDAAMKALIELCVDICKRYNIKQMLWTGNKANVGNIAVQNVGAHRWFANKSCPGDYLYDNMDKIAAEVNKRLSNSGNEDSTITLIDERIRKANPLYQDINDVPVYWRPAIQELLDLDIINGGTPRDVCATDVNLTMDTVKAIVIMKAYIDKKYGGATDAK